MRSSRLVSKQLQVTTWVKRLSTSSSNVIVSNYSYNCLISGKPRTKTLIVFPDEVETKGIIAIDKPLDDVGLPDIIKLYSRINHERDRAT